MRILVVNDDGIRSPGIEALARVAAQLGETYVVAPNEQCSGMSQKLSIFDEMALRRVEFPAPVAGAWSLGGTPADCVKIGIRQLLPTPPDLVLSGINLGPNAGISVLYSGTVSAATEALILGYPAIAFSLTTFTDPCWDTAARVARRIVEQVASGGLRLTPDTLWNVNIPNVPYAALRGIRLSRMGESRFIEHYTPVRDAAGHPCWTMQGDLVELGDPDGTDLQALRENCVSLTPIRLDRTHHAALASLRRNPPAL